MVDMQQFNRLKEGVAVWNQWRRSNPNTHLDFSDADLSGFDLKGADLIGADMRRAFLRKADMQGTLLNEAHLEGADLREANMQKALLIGARLEGADLNRANLERSLLNEAKLEWAKLNKANLKRANLSRASLEGTDLREANLERVNLSQATLGGKLMCDNDLSRIQDSDFPEILPPTDLQGAIFNSETNLEDITLGNTEYGFVLIADVHWNGVNLSVINWSSEMILGDERNAQACKHQGCGREKLLETFQKAVRANHQFAAALRDQGLNERADHFAYHAKMCDQQLLLLNMLQDLVILPKFSWLGVKPTPYHLKRLYTLAILVCISLVSLSWFVLTLGPETLTEYMFREIVLFPLIVGLLLSLLVLAFYQPLVRLTLISLFLLLFSLGLLIAGFLLLLSFLFHPTSLFIVLALLASSMSIALFSGKRIKNRVKKIFLLISPYITVQGDYGRYLFSGFLYLLAGYGYKPARALFWYLAVIFGFATAYYVFGHLSVFPPDAFVYSLTSFHGRGFFPGLEAKPSLHDPLVMLAALEAVIGLFIEISFIATFTQRYFGK